MDTGEEGGGGGTPVFLARILFSYSIILGPDPISSPQQMLKLKFNLDACN